MPMSARSEALLAEVRANSAKLAACKRHEFQPITPGLFGTRYVCPHCTGTADGVSVLWYNRGLEHAQKK